ncbi:MAG TPA: hypothetical protein VFB50_01155 [Chloroflexota bacterium]|nr:hypothetical protein [Chloroflexota bacterium]
MSINLERSIHPDLLEETLAEAEAVAEAPAAPRRRRGNRSAPSPEASPPGDAQAPVDGTEGDSGGDVSPSPEPAELTDLQRLAQLLKSVPRDEMEKDDTIRGWLGDAANQRARRMLEDQSRQQQERERQQAYDRGDLYALGQLDAQGIQSQRQMLEAQAQAQAAANPYLQAVTEFQKTLPEDVQKDVQGKTYAPGGTPAEGFQAYLQAVHESAIRHGLEAEVRKREPALRKAELNSTVGGEMTPELDGGPAQAYREITDAQVAAMTLEEYDRYFDDKGRPRPGVRVQLTRGIDVRREQSRR